MEADNRRSMKRILTLATLVGLGLIGVGKVTCSSGEAIKAAKEVRTTYSTEEVTRNPQLQAYDFDYNGRLDEAEAEAYNTSRK